MKNNMDNEELLQKAKNRALRILERAPKTAKQLSDKLKEDGIYSDDIISEVIDYVINYHFIDDRQYAEDYIYYNSNRKSIRTLLYELKNKGIEEKIIGTLKEEYDDFDQSETIRLLIKKKGISLNDEDKKKKDKLLRFLMSRGFSYEQIKNTCRHQEDDF